MIGRFRDPVRLADDPSAPKDGVGGLIARVRREAPDDREVAALFTRIEERVTDLPLSATSSTVTNAAAPSQVPLLAATKVSLLLKGGLLLLGGAGVIAAAGFWLRTPQPVVATNSATTVSTTATTTTTLSTSPDRETGEPPVAARSPALKTGVGSSVGANSPSPTKRVASGVRPRANEVSAPVRGTSPLSKPDTDSEADLLRAALEALPLAPRTALRLADDHARRYPDGVLTQEREVIAIEALAKLGQRTSARLRAQQLLRKHPSTVHNARIEALLETTP
jgi:hypothetical protein